ncbi:MAG TPA: NifU family protein [Terriglobia bacterium]|nr:NifU family protein [Terriglobia bacterium]
MDDALKQRIGRIEPLVTQLKSATDPALRAVALELVQILMDFHGAGLDRMMEIVAESGHPGWDLIETFGRDEVVANMLLLHGLHPQDLETRVRRALDNVRPLLRSHGGNVDLVEIVDGVVRLRLMGSCDGCSSSSLTLKNAIEKSVHESAPDVICIEVIGGKHGTSSEVTASRTAPAS